MFFLMGIPFYLLVGIMFKKILTPRSIFCARICNLVMFCVLVFVNVAFLICSFVTKKLKRLNRFHFELSACECMHLVAFMQI